MAYHKSFRGYSSNESLSGQVVKSGSLDRGHCGQVPPSGNDTAARIYAETPTSASGGTISRSNSSNHVTRLQSATNPRSNHSTLANHCGNFSANIPNNKAHLPISSFRLQFPSLSSLPPLPPPPSEFSRIVTLDAMQSPYHHIDIAHDDRSYQQYSTPYGLASSSQHKLPGNFGSNLSCHFVPQYNGSQHDGGASRKTSGLDGYDYNSDRYGLGGENYELSDIDMELDSDPEYPSQSANDFSPMDDHHHHHPSFPPDDPCSFTPLSECEAQWYISDTNPEENSCYPWRTVGKEHWQQSETPEPPTYQVESFDNNWLHSFYPLPSDETVYSDTSTHDADVRNANNTPSDISSSASPLSPIDGLTYPVSHFPPIVASSLSTQAPYPYSCHQMTGISYPYTSTGVYEPAYKSSTTTSAPFITAFLNGNGFANPPARSIPTVPVLHAPRPVRPIPTVSFEDLAASISNI
ncbi:hypothetical protein E1B28_001666 [Marasmius oreades]|uniref:Uncharacterized protein n=1 Tax=Marasmius oreades TaxID=181124 RepID=A0A9P7V482_9AGAR|nr:uncharacterized protein E1B28_001666 [Marasmius oreades]KAG7099862.1 hypothetical protein E1B28_001666 [Marasmius oreades]